MQTYQNLQSFIENLLLKSPSSDGNFQVKETVALEFKESANKLPKDFWETYSAFSNTKGGYVILGVSEKNQKLKICGINNPDQQIRDIFNIANNKQKCNLCNIENDNDNVSEHIIDGKTIISVYIPELSIERKPLYLNGNPLYAYVRGNEGDYKISEDDLRRFMRNAQNEIDNELLEEYTLEDLNMESVLSFKNIVHSRKTSQKYLEMDDFQFLSEMGVFQIDRKNNRSLKLTLAGLLFLGKQEAILQKVPHFHLDYINKRNSGVNRWKDRISTGDISYPQLNLFEFYRIVKEKLNLTVEDKFELDSKSVRKSSTELEIALREALANMIIHADYLDPETSLKIEVDNLYYTFLNPGTMKISEAQFFSGGKSIPRNHTLFSYFRQMGEAEHAGTGGKEILKVITKNDYRLPDLETNNKYTLLKLWVAAPVQTFSDLSKEAKQIYEYINEKIVDVSMNDIISFTGYTKYRAYKAIKELLERKIIISTGKGRAVSYQRVTSIVEQLDAADQFRNLIMKQSKVKTDVN